MSVSSYAGASRRGPRSNAERQAAYQPRRRRLHQLILLAGLLQHGPVSMVPLTCIDHLTSAQWHRVFQSWARLAEQAGLITWAVAFHHPYDRSGRATQPGVHVLCDLAPGARRRLASHRATPVRWRDFGRVKLDEHGLTFAELAHRAGVHPHAHFRVVDNGVGYLVGRQWDGRSAWVFNRDVVSGFIPSSRPPMSTEYGAILRAMRETGSDREAIQVARSLLTSREVEASAGSEAPRQRPAPRPLPPARAPRRQAKLLAPDGLITRWIHGRCTLHPLDAFEYAYDRPVVRRADAIADFHDWCVEHNHTRPPRQDFPQAMDTRFRTGLGYWDLITLRDQPVQAQDVWNVGPPAPWTGPTPQLPPMPEPP